MKKTLLIFLTAVGMIAGNVNAQTCTVNEINASVRYDDSETPRPYGACAGEYIEVNVERMGNHTGTLTLSKVGGTIDVTRLDDTNPDLFIIYNAQLSDAGTMIVTFTEDGTGCIDTAQVKVRVNKNPNPIITDNKRCNGQIYFDAKDQNNTPGRTYHWQDINGNFTNAAGFRLILGPGSYLSQAVQITSSAGCKGVGQTVGTISNEVMSVQIQDNGGTLSAVTNHPVSTYRWKYEGAIVGGNSQTLPYMGPGTYSVWVRATTASGGCAAQICVEIGNGLRVLEGINDFSELQAYPNPASSTFTVAGAGKDVSLYDTQGREVYAFASDNDIQTVNADLPNGTYVLKVKNSTESLKVVIQK